MSTAHKQINIREIQGDSLYSPFANETVLTFGKVTGVVKRGFFLQTPGKQWDGKGSDGLFVYSPDWQAELDACLEVSGTVVDYLKHEKAKPVTQLQLQDIKVLPMHDARCECQVEPYVFGVQDLQRSNPQLASHLNALEGMLIKIPAGQTFIAPSNPFGDYVVLPDGLDVQRADCQGVLVNPHNPLRWFPGFRIQNYNKAPRLNVGARLGSDIYGPLNYRSDSYQLAVSESFDFEPEFVNLTASDLQSEAGYFTVLTLNCFNLDPHIESEDKVLNPTQDIDDDWGDGRFHTLAQAVVLQARCPDILALQEIQDNDGAEHTEVVDASDTYELLISTIEELSGIRYAWADVNPELGADGGQPGGNIRNAYMYNPQRVELVIDSVQALGKDDPAFEGSRKPLFARFREKPGSRELACFNVHLASKRHQHSIFAPERPEYDPKEAIRIAQARFIANQTKMLANNGNDFYVTGDFNDTEFSHTLNTICADHSSNLVLQLPPEQRYDYNHRGKLQVLMHGIVPNTMLEQGRVQYEIIHGNELIGVQAGEANDKPSDHAYVLAKLKLA